MFWRTVYGSVRDFTQDEFEFTCETLIGFHIPCLSPKCTWHKYQYRWESRRLPSRAEVKLGETQGMMVLWATVEFAMTRRLVRI